jgi:hypothetical protein
MPDVLWEMSYLVANPADSAQIWALLSPLVTEARPLFLQKMGSLACALFWTFLRPPGSRPCIFGTAPGRAQKHFKLIHRRRVMSNSESIGQYTCITEKM